MTKTKKSMKQMRQDAELYRLAQAEALMRGGENVRVDDKGKILPYSGRAATDGNNEQQDQQGEPHPRPWAWTFGGGAMGAVFTVRDANRKEVVTFVSDSGDITPFYRGLVTLLVKAVNDELDERELLTSSIRISAPEARHE